MNLINDKAGQSSVNYRRSRRAPRCWRSTRQTYVKPIGKCYTVTESDLSKNVKTGRMVFLNAIPLLSKGLDMIALKVTDEQLEQLRYERFHHPHPRVQKKIEVIFLRANGLSVGDTCRIAGVSANTYRAYLRDFQAGGVEGLKRFDCEGSTSQLDGHADQIIESLVEQPVRTLAEAQQRIIELTGIERSREQVRQFLRRSGFKPLKVGSMPAKADVDAQAVFKKKYLIRG